MLPNFELFRGHARRAAAHTTVGIVLVATRVSAAPPDDSGVFFELTDASSVLYNSDNRDTRAGQVASVANDGWGVFYNRLNLHATRGFVTMAVRVDNAWFYASRTPAVLAGELASSNRFASVDQREEFFRNKATEAGLELSNRFINWIYPTKVTLSAGTPDLEIAVGDSYAEFGRGLVLSVRKLDELASDTTLRGVRASARVGEKNTRFKLTVLGGSLNPLRIDEASGRYLGVDSSVTPGFLKLTEAGMPRAVATDFVDDGKDCLHTATCSYAPDRMIAGQAELSLSGTLIATQASMLLRQAALSPDPIRSADTVLTASESVDFSRLGKYGALYVEAALQKLSHDGANEANLAFGHAVYLAASFIKPHFSLLAELKHYRRFFPLLANISTARAREFGQLQYSAPPTTEEVWTDSEFGSFNTCVSGGRLKGEVHALPTHSIYGWVGHYRTFAESAANERCEIADRYENRVWDVAVGMDARPRARRARWSMNLGSRFDHAEHELQGPEGPTKVFYRELFLRYDISEPLVGKLALELQGVHRRRREPIGGLAEPWLAGSHSTGVEWSEQLGVAVGVEYDGRPGVADGYLNAAVSYRPFDFLSLALFAGQRRGAMRCVGGVCRVYPPFEGLRLDATVRY